MINVHFSLLPRWRGAAPVERALLAGDDVTGVCIMGVEEALDTGPVYARREVPIGRATTADELRAELVDVGTRLLVDVLAGPLPDAGAAGRRADVRREDRRPPSCASAGTVRPSSSTGGCASAGRGRRSATAASRSTTPTLVPRRAGRARVASAPTRRPSARATARCGCVTVQPEGKAPMRWPDFANGAHPTRRAPRPLTPSSVPAIEVSARSRRAPREHSGGTATSSVRGGDDVLRPRC